MPAGGSRPGAGRKPKTDEQRIRDLAVKALISKYGQEEAAFAALLDSKEPSLIKFVYEHAFGKPREKVELDTNQPITLTIIREPATTPILAPSPSAEGNKRSDTL